MSKPIARQKLAPGMTVLLGMPGHSMPGEWWLGTIIWIGGDEILVETYPPSQCGKGEKSLQHVSWVRAIGTIHELGEIQRGCRDELKLLTDAVKEAEEALRSARDAVYARLDEIAAAEPMREAGGGI
ncbi:MAG: hypothetical protein E5Y10_22090 [Mesorhizobium sp.]|uniref:hypothetical protein n=1 Tax=Mesorhizobium sp. TaxID=1871066 RepID=UPI001215BCA1|nr:hypothetical protein [Mesorhizobium sp.]TIN36822.1 MAG: hypothetical protein E5Y13_22700 [Mesorhizobium sp.]TJU73574.1 MAG: hypothetical protein E5Y15_32690 [Mesorhizobium sp.]TJU86667.1 MAG: hypothetical protein E5Y10_22090 [Mesorhizobium sp.]